MSLLRLLKRGYHGSRPQAKIKPVVPTWAIFPAATQLVVQSFKHPNTGKAVVVDESAREVKVVSIDDAAAHGAETQAAAVASIGADK